MGDKLSVSYYKCILTACLFIVTLVIGAVPGTASAGSTFYAITPAGGSQYLVEFDLDSVENETIEVSNSVMLNYDGGDAAFFTNAIAFSPTGELYGWSSRSTLEYEGMGQLYTIDVGTGEMTMIGEPQGRPGVYGMAFDSDGTLYGIASQHLYSIDTGTGVRTQITTDPIVDLNGGLTFDYTTGELYAWTGNENEQDQIVHIDKTTGAAEYIPVNFDVEYDFVGAEINPDNGEMVAVRGGSMVYSTDIDTGEGAYIGMVTLNGDPIRTHSLTVVPVVPEPVSSTLFVIGAATLGFRRLRKRIKN